jgi:transcriptional regulator GlxA family with amidase domain
VASHAQGDVGPPIDVWIVAVPETAGSALYGMVDVLSAAGNIWQTLVGEPPCDRRFRPRIVSETDAPFRCGNAIPVTPDAGIGDVTHGDIVILPELWLGPDEGLEGRYSGVLEWIRRRHAAGACIYSACSGAVMLAETGLLDGCMATSHWGYRDLFARQYPSVRFMPEPNLVFADGEGRIVTAGGTTSWHDLAIHLIARYLSPGEALRIAQVYLLKWHGEGQLPYTPLVRRTNHADALVRECEEWLAEGFRAGDALRRAVARTGVAERTLKRRFKAATGLTLIQYLQNCRIEAAKRQLEGSHLSVDAISADVGYEDPAFFRRLFKRSTGLTPSEYRRLFQPVASAGGEHGR